MSRFYDKAVWRGGVGHSGARDLQLHRQPLCEICSNSGQTVAARHVDHIVPISQGGAPLDPANFRSLCPSCHSQVTQRQLKETDKPMKACNAVGLPTDPAHPWHQK